ncbi:MAG: peptide chain release factor 1 [Chlamydiia bacterium]|nr:peptide chain release factor 1 [Chlamydiia bacterium]
MEKKISQLLARLEEVENELSSSSVVNDQILYRKLTQEHAYLTEIKEVYSCLEKAYKQLSENEELLKIETHEEMRLLFREDVLQIQKSVSKLEDDLKTLLVPPDPNDSRNVIVELRAGTGGDEASLFVGDCVRMYHLYAEKRGWNYEVLGASSNEVGGYREYIMVMSGKNVRRFMQYEAGTHRVQRVPATETQGRIHTSAITVAVLLEPSEEEEVNIVEKDLRIDTYRASGAGGQHVNVTDSAVRITHIPTGLVASCQDERSQHKNKDKALRLLKARIAEVERKKREEEEASTRASQVGSGDRSERIRTYNFAQNRVTDHRINLTLYSLDRVLEGELDPITTALVSHYYQKQLSE